MLVSVKGRAQEAKPPVAQAGFYGPLLIDGAQKGFAWIFPSDHEDHFYISTQGLLQVLQPLLKPQHFEKLKNILQHHPVVSVAELRSADILARFDEQNLNVALQVPNSLRELQVTEIGGRDAQAIPKAQVAPFSGYLNLRGTAKYGRVNGENTDAWQPSNASGELVQQVQGLVFQTEYEYNDGQPQIWKRDDTRLTYDFPDALVRTTVGDLDAPVAGFQNPIPLGGLSVVLNYQLRPYENAKPLSRTQVEIRQPSWVEVYINGIPFERFHADPGLLDLSHLPLMNGANRVSLRLTDDLGKVEVVDLSLLFDPTILKEGGQEFAYQVGYPWSYSAHGSLLDRDYDRENLVTSFFHRFGLTSWWTVGLNYQGDQWRKEAEFDSALLTPIGLFEPTFASSWDRNLNGQAFRLLYHTLDEVNGKSMRTLLQLSAEYRDPFFLLPLASSVRNQYSWIFNTRVAERFSDSATAGISYLYGIDRVGGADERQAIGDITWSLTNAWNVTASMTRSYAPTDETQVFLTLNWQELGSGRSAIARYNSVNSSTDVTLEQRPPRSLERWTVDAELEKSQDDHAGMLNASYQGYRGEFAARQEYRHTESGTGNEGVTSVTGATALVWTQDAIAFSRPVADSFAIFPQQDEALRDQVIDVNLDQYGPLAESGFLGPAVLPDLISYYDRSLAVSSPTLPAGVKLSQDVLKATPRYRSAAEVPIKISGAVAVSGKVVLPNGEPAALLTGEVIEKATGKVVADFFSGRTGRFLVEGLNPGSYEIDWYGGNFVPVTFEVPAKALGILRLQEPLIVKETP